MEDKRNRPVLLVPLGLKHWFVEKAYPEGTVPFHEVRDIDPTYPGLEEFEEAIGADWEDDIGKPARKPALRLVYSNGLRINP